MSVEANGYIGFTIYRVSCDACGEYIREDCPLNFMSRDEVERSANNRGWMLDGDSSYCPACWARLEAEGD